MRIDRGDASEFKSVGTPAHDDRDEEARSSRAAARRCVPVTILPGYQWAPQWVPARTPTVHWGPISGKAVGGPNTVQHSSTVQKHGKQFFMFFFFFFFFLIFFYNFLYFFPSVFVPDHPHAILVHCTLLSAQ